MSEVPDGGALLWESADKVEKAVMSVSYEPGLVSVVVPTYNREFIVGATLDSILAQTYQSLEIIVVDDGSTDGTRLVLRDYANRNPGRIIILEQPNAGPATARNRGLRHARGEFIAFLDSDDQWHPEKLEKQIPLFAPGVGLVYCGLEEIDENNNVLSLVMCDPQMRGDIYPQLLVKNRMTGGTVILRREVLDTIGDFDEGLRAAENWDLWIRISREYKVDFVDLPLVRYRKHAGGISRDTERMREAAQRVMEKHLGGAEAPLDEDHREIHAEAWANFYYRWAIERFAVGDYRRTRRLFRRCWQYVPSYGDSRLRYFRTLLGTKVNRILASLKGRFP